MFNIIILALVATFRAGKRGSHQAASVERLGLDREVIERELTLMREGAVGWPEVIRGSFLSAGLMERYLGVLREKVERLWGACGA